MVGGRLVKLDVSREETFVCNRVRHAIRTHIISWVRPDGSFAARKIECFSDQGAYASHGHGVVAKGMGAFPQLYPCPNVEGDAYSVFTNKPAAGAMRGYGIPPVSYTHLDVYKRQMRTQPHFSFFFNRWNTCFCGSIYPGRPQPADRLAPRLCR